MGDQSFTKKHSSEMGEFSFLGSIGRIYPKPSVKNVENDAESSKRRLLSNNKPISLYKPPNSDGAQRQCSFFTNEHTPEIRSSFSSFRRHQKEETLRKEWEKVRAPIVKLYKSERKSAVRHLRKGIEQERTKQKGKNDEQKQKGKNNEEQN